MAQSKVTLKEIMVAVRELTFDRFIIPAFAIKQMGKDVYIDIDPSFKPVSEEPVEPGRLRIFKKETSIDPDTETEEIIEKPIVELLFADYPEVDDILNQLIDQGIVIAYTPYYRSEEPSASLIKTTFELTEDRTIFRRYFFADEEIIDVIQWYYYTVLRIPNAEINDELVGLLKRPSERHLSVWVAYQLVDKRRMYEAAANSIGQSFTDGSDYTGSSGSSSPTSTTVQIGSVFSITEDAQQGYFYEDFNRVGSDNTWGDRYSFWYKLMLYLRNILEEHFGDYRLRKDNVIPGYISLQRELDFREYFDSYPFTLSPLSRGILSKTP